MAVRSPLSRTRLLKSFSTRVQLDLEPRKSRLDGVSDAPPEAIASVVEFDVGQRVSMNFSISAPGDEHEYFAGR